jgi:ParB-like nuclease domain
MSEEISSVIGAKPDLLWVPVDKIRVDHNYQRDIRSPRVRQILREFNWSQFQPVMLAEQSDGTFTVFDGQHRVAAARLHPAVSEVPAAVVRLDGSQAEAAAFLGVNVNRTAVGTVEKFWAGIEAGDASMVRVRDVLARAGCEVIQAHGIKAAANRTHAVTAIERAIRSYGEQAVVLACETLSSAWSKDTNALRGVFISALARLFHNNKGVIQKDRMRIKLASSDSKAMASAAEMLRKIGGGDAALNLSKAIVEIYNKGLSQNQIHIGSKG